MQVRSPAVSGSGVVLDYPGRIVTENSDFTIPAGNITAVIGPNGSGKSTLLSAIAGLHPVREGSINYPLAAPGDPRISYVLQTTKVNESLPITVKEVVAMGRYATAGRFGRFREADHDAVLRAMKRTGIESLANRHLSLLSGGQRQRVFVAQGLAQDHDLLLLDEPLTGIDLTTAQAIDEVVHEEIDEGCAVVITTHDLSEAQIADHVILLSGRVVAEGPPDRVLTSDNLTEAYGAALLHLEGEVMMLDDPAHQPVPGRHTHRTVGHPESNPGNVHGDD